MRIFIAGIDGYLGWALAQHLIMRGHEVVGIDNGIRRRMVSKIGGQSALPIGHIYERQLAFMDHYRDWMAYPTADITQHRTVELALLNTNPDAIVHLAEIPSAPYSMIDVEHASFVQRNNIIGTLNLLWAMKDICPDAHLVKLGTMGEYGTPNIDIPEGFIDVEYRGRHDTLPFPRQAGSWYHLTKVHDSANIQFACKIWGLRSTDIMQGVVYGTRIDNQPEDPRLFTRLDFDQAFGTVINRYACQAVIGEPITPYGAGHQKRGFLPLRDSMQCLTLAIENPPEAGEYRVFNQFQEVYDLTELAHNVRKVAWRLGLPGEIRHVENPRQEAERHYYNPDHQHLLDLGYKPTADMDSELEIMMTDLLRYKDRIEAKRDVLMPDIRWDGTRRRSEYIEEVVHGD